MVMPAGNIAFSPEFVKIKTELQNARDHYITLVEEYSQLVNVVGKNLETEYMLKLGKKEHELFSCHVEILRIKREIAIFQAARNRGETVSAEEVKLVIEREFAEYKKQLEEQCKKLQSAQEHFSAPKLTDEKTKVFKKLYHDIVRKLHPDLNPDLPAGAAELWERVQTAYKANYWDELFLLSDMADELLEGKIDFVESINSMEQIKEELSKITNKISDLEKQIADTNKRVPYSYETLLANPAEVMRKREALDEEIKLCKEHIVELKKIRAQF